MGEEIMILELVIKYWVEFLLGLIATALGVVCKKMYGMYKSEKQHQKTKEQKEFYKGLEDLIKQNQQVSREVEASLQQELGIVKEGLLSIQKKNFKQECKALLQENHEITLQEFENIQEEHNIYKSLGGNHDGDQLFELVSKKAEKNLLD